MDEPDPTVIEHWWRVKKPGGGGTVWCPTDPTEQIATGQAPAWEGSTVDGPFVLASTTHGAVEAARDADVASMQAAFWRARAIELGADPGEWAKRDREVFGGQ